MPTDIAPLLTAQGWALLESITLDDGRTANECTRDLIEGGNDPTTVAAAIEQAHLREQARGMFGPFATGMLFTAAGLDAATPLSVAAHHAQRFATANCAQVADLGCGIGGDTMALASLDRQVLAVEWDEATAAAATVNTRHWPEVRVLHADATTVDLHEFEGIYVHPDLHAPRHSAHRPPPRKPAAGKRESRPAPPKKTTAKHLLDGNTGSPAMDFALELSARHRAVGICTSAELPHHLAPETAETQWVSWNGQAVEATLWLGDAARLGIRRSVLLVPGPHDPHGTTEQLTDADLALPGSGDLLDFLYDPDPAVTRAGLVAQAAAVVSGHQINPTTSLLSSGTRVKTRIARGYRIIDILNQHPGQLQTWLTNHGYDNIDFLKRGTSVDTTKLRRQLTLNEGLAPQATCVITRIHGQPQFILCQQLA